jgi:hypothetical protein
MIFCCNLHLIFQLNSFKLLDIKAKMINMFHYMKLILIKKSLLLSGLRKLQLVALEKMTVFL